MSKDLTEIAAPVLTRQPHLTLTMTLFFGLATTSCSSGSADHVNVFCAASLAPAIESIAAAYGRSTGETLNVNAAATSTLARQILRGAPADLFLAADPTWTKALYDAGVMSPAARPVSLTNHLVWVAASSSPPDPNWKKVPVLRRLAIADPAHVPAGAYARSALQSLGWWAALAPKVLPGADVRSALRYVTHGEADAAIVYRSDTIALPADLEAWALGTQPRIEYAAAVSDRRRNKAAGFLRFLETPEARGTLKAFGLGTGLDGSFNASQASKEAGIWPIILLSIKVAVLGILCTLVPGVMLAWVLARKTFRGKILVEALVDLPLVLPPVVVGWALLMTFGRDGPLGGLGLSFSTLGAGIAAAVMGFPLLVRSVRLAIEYVDTGLEDAASVLGVSPWRTWWSITLPLALPGVATGALLAFARSLGEFGATITFAGSIPGHTRTLPLAIYSSLQAPGGDALVLKLVGVSVAVSLAAVLLSELLKRQRLSRRDS